MPTAAGVCVDCGKPIHKGSKRCGDCHRNGRNAAREARGWFPLNGLERQECGALLTFENQDGARITLHRTGPLVGVVAEMCAYAARIDPTYRLIAYSTPETILTDMSGGRSTASFHGRDIPRPLPEQMMLSRAGHPEMLHDRLRFVGRRAEQRDEQQVRPRRSR